MNRPKTYLRFPQHSLQAKAAPTAPSITQPKAVLKAPAVYAPFSRATNPGVIQPMLRARTLVRPLTSVSASAPFRLPSVARVRAHTISATTSGTLSSSSSSSSSAAVHVSTLSSSASRGFASATTWQPRHLTDEEAMEILKVPGSFLIHSTQELRSAITPNLTGGAANRGLAFGVGEHDVFFFDNLEPVYHRAYIVIFLKAKVHRTRTENMEVKTRESVDMKLAEGYVTYEQFILIKAKIDSEKPAPQKTSALTRYAGLLPGYKPRF